MPTKKKKDFFAPLGNPMITQWDTTKTSGSATASNKIALPLNAGQTIDITVDWGDGNKENFLSSDDPNLIHTYSSTGIYTIKIYKNNGIGYIGWHFFSCPVTHRDNNKILDISEFGDILVSLSANIRTFWFCQNLDITAQNFYDNCIAVSTTVIEAFRSCNKMFTFYDIENWDVSHITDFNQFLSGCTLFNRDISGWDVSNATSLQGMLTSCINFNQNVNTWTVNADNISFCFSVCTSFNSSVSNWTHQFTNIASTFSGCNSFEGTGLEFWDTSLNTSFSNTFNNCDSLSVSAIAGITSFNTGNCTTFFRMFLSATPPALASADFSGYNVSKATSLADMFGISNFAGSVAGWTLRATTPVDCNNMFRSCVNFNGSLNGWTNTSSITNTSSMFLSCSSYNQPMNNWTLTNCTSMASMFNGCYSFNSALFPPPPAITGSAASVFSGCYVFNQDVTSWNVSNITNFTNMFNDARAFNQNISTWTTTAATNMRGMFQNAWIFNQPIGNWDVDQVGDFEYMFNRTGGVGVFDQDLSNWVITSATGFTNFLNGQTLSTVNYDALLIAWEALPPPNGLTINAGGSKYTPSIAATGTNDSVASFKLIDSTATFITNEVAINDIVHNGTGQSYCKVLAIDSETQLSISLDKFLTTGVTYNIETSNAAKAKESLRNTYSWTFSDGGPAPLTDQLIGYFRLHNSETDEVGNLSMSNNGVTYANGIYTGNALEAADFNAATDNLRIADNNLLSFGNATTDKPFSVTCIVNATNFGVLQGGFYARPIIVKRGTTSTSNREWQLSSTDFVSPNHRIRFTCHDQSTGGNIYAESTIAPSNSTNYHFGGTYNGAGTHTGLRVYIDGVNDTASTALSGSYTAMENLAEDVRIGEFSWLTGAGLLGRVEGIGIWRYALTPYEMNYVYTEQSSGNNIL